MERKIQVEFVANRNDRRFRTYKSEKVANKKINRFLEKFNLFVNKVNENDWRTEYVCHNNSYRIIVMR